MGSPSPDRTRTGSAADAPPNSGPAPGPIFDPGESTLANGSSLTETQSPPKTRLAFLRSSSHQTAPRRVRSNTDPPQLDLIGAKVF